MFPPVSGFGPIQWVHMTRHESHRSFWLNRSLVFFLASSLYLAMMRILRDVAARVVFRMNCLLQFFTPEELHRLEVRWDTKVFKLVSLRERF